MDRHIFGPTTGGIRWLVAPRMGNMALKGLTPQPCFGSFTDLAGTPGTPSFPGRHRQPQVLLSARKRNGNVGSMQDLSKFKVGDVFEGTVSSIKLYGAFLDIGGGVSGLLHISQISHEWVSNVTDVISVGSKIKVMVLAQNLEKGRLTFSTRKLEPEPGDMMHNPKKVYNNAEKMAVLYKEGLAHAEALFASSPGEDM